MKSHFSKCGKYKLEGTTLYGDAGDHWTHLWTDYNIRAGNVTDAINRYERYLDQQQLQEDIAERGYPEE